jgi:hypothetical protein
MSYKTYCDMCGEEITSRNEAVGSSFSGSRLGGKTQDPTKQRWMCFEVSTGLDNVWNAGNFCKYCIIDAIKRLDNRPQILT